MRIRDANASQPEALPCAYPQNLGWMGTNATVAPAGVTMDQGLWREWALRA
jgi:hypothetical protein